MDEHAVVLESWLPVDPQLRHQAARLMPGDTLTFRYTNDELQIVEAAVPYEQVKLIQARLVLKGEIK